MSRGRKKTTELGELEAGLGEAADPYMIADLIPLELEELAEMAQAEIRYTAVSMIRAGRIFKAIKKKIRDAGGKWEEFVESRRWTWNYVYASLRLIEVAARFPQAVHLPPGKATHSLLRRPMFQIEEVLRDLPAEAVKKLTVWDLEKIYDKKKIEREQSKERKPPKNLPREIPSVDEIDGLVIEAEGALRQIAELDLKTSASRKKFHQYAIGLSALADRATYNLNDPDHLSTPPWEFDPMQDDISGTISEEGL